MSRTCSYRPHHKAVCVVLAGLLVALPAWSGDPVVRVGPRAGYYLLEVGKDRARVMDILTKLADAIPELVRGTPDCASLQATSWGKTPTINSSTDTWTKMESFRAQCWAFLKLPREALVISATAQDGITRAMTDALMSYILDKSATDDEWLKNFTAFPGGDLTCKTPWQCTLTLPDGKDYPDHFLYIDLMLAYGNRRFLEVAQAVHGSPRFVYAVELDVSEPVPKVASLNFTP